MSWASFLRTSVTVYIAQLLSLRQTRICAPRPMSPAIAEDTEHAQRSLRMLWDFSAGPTSTGIERYLGMDWVSLPASATFALANVVNAANPAPKPRRLI